ncbi:MAG: hypothetical protein NTU61_05475 [Candidatus Altiarchaeota archaeon]|nr:hypothetical protein [Candidatus Altiarchaeota archaeon]
MEFKFVEKKKGVVEIEFDEKEIPICLASTLVRNGVDAYWYEPHPLIPGIRLHVKAGDAMKEFKSAVKDLNDEWSGFKKLVEGKSK